MTKSEEKQKIQNIINNLKKAERIMILNNCDSVIEIQAKIEKYTKIKRGI